MALKRLPTDKTVLTELKLVLADRFARNRLLSESMAARVTNDQGVRTGDATVTRTRSIILNDIQSMIYVHSWGPMLLRLQFVDTAVQEMPCSGLFLMYGQITSVEIHAAREEDLRLSYVYS